MPLNETDLGRRARTAVQLNPYTRQTARRWSLVPSRNTKIQKKSKIVTLKVNPSDFLIMERYMNEGPKKVAFKEPSEEYGEEETDEETEEENDEKSENQSEKGPMKQPKKLRTLKLYCKPEQVIEAPREVAAAAISASSSIFPNPTLTSSTATGQMPNSAKTARDTIISLSQAEIDAVHGLIQLANSPSCIPTSIGSGHVQNNGQWENHGQAHNEQNNVHTLGIPVMAFTQDDIEAAHTLLHLTYGRSGKPSTD